MAVETSDQHGAVAQESGLFIRKSSGLVRELGWKETFGIGAGVLVVIYGFAVPMLFLQFFPNADFYIPLVIGGVIFTTLFVLAYSQLVSTFPRSGGEFVYASRIFFPGFGALVGGAVLIAVILNCANTVVPFSFLALGVSLAAIGEAFGWLELTSWANANLSLHTPQLITGLVLIAIFFFIGTRSLATGARVALWSFAVSIVAFVVMLVLLLTTSRTEFIQAFNDAAGNPNAFAEVLSKAQDGGFKPGITTAAVISALPIGALIFAGGSFANYASGEIRRPNRTYLWTTIALMLISLGCFFLVWTALRHVAGLPFLQSSAHFSAADPVAYAEVTGNVNYYQGGMAWALMLSGDPVTKLIIGVGVFFSFFANALAYYLMASRVVFALSFDRLLPTKLANVHERTRAPLFALSFVTVILVAWQVLGTYTGWQTLFRNLILIFYVIFVVGLICAAALPFRRRDLYEASPHTIRGRWLGLPAVTIVATLAALGFAFLVYLLATKPGYYGSYGWSSILTLGVTATFGGFLYVGSRWWHKRRGVDLRMAMSELPPE